MLQNKKSRTEPRKLGFVMLIISWVMAIALIWILSQKLFFSTKPQEIIKIGEQTNITIHKNTNGHYNITGYINNYKTKFLIDTGASYISISEALADKLNLKKIGRVTVSTASGEVSAYKTRIDSLIIGQIKLTNLSATIMPNVDRNFALLGMNVLEKFKILQTDDTMTLTYK